MQNERPQTLRLDCFDEEVVVQFAMSSSDGTHAGGPLGLLPVRAVQLKRAGRVLSIEIELAGVQLPAMPPRC